MKIEDEGPVFPGLPKWPAFVARGEAVTQDQAAEIIIRTNGSLDFGHTCNDREWCCQLNGAVGLPADPHEEDLRGGWERVQEVDANYGLLNLDYLTNSCIASAYIGGPGGWVDWTGNIRTRPGHNIGKWPSCEEVLGEWETIATTWPFLDLRCQLWSAEACEDHGNPVIEYVIKGGSVSVELKPRSPMEPERMDISGAALGLLSPACLRERGCTLKQFQDALEITALGITE